MEKIYVVCWASGSTDDHGNAHAYSGTAGAYRDKADSLKALEIYRDETLQEVYDDLDPDGDMPEERDRVQVYGSITDEYFEIDYILGTEPVELYMGISETTLA